MTTKTTEATSSVEVQVKKEEAEIAKFEQKQGSEKISEQVKEQEALQEKITKCLEKLAGYNNETTMKEILLSYTKKVIYGVYQKLVVRISDRSLNEYAHKSVLAKHAAKWAFYIKNNGHDVNGSTSGIFVKICKAQKQAKNETLTQAAKAEVQKVLLETQLNAMEAQIRAIFEDCSNDTIISVTEELIGEKLNSNQEKYFLIREAAEKIVLAKAIWKAQSTNGEKLRGLCALTSEY